MKKVMLNTGSTKPIVLDRIVSKTNPAATKLKQLAVHGPTLPFEVR